MGGGSERCRRIISNKYLSIRPLAGVAEGSSVCGRQKANHGLCEVSGLCI